MSRAEPGSVAIIGGGIVGIACAHYLAENGHKVTVIDSDRIAAACSYGNCGYICPSHVLPLATPASLREGFASLLDSTAAFRIKPRLEAEFVRWLWRFARRCNSRDMLESGLHLHAILQSSLSEYASLLDGTIDGVDSRKPGLLYAFETSRALGSFSEEARQLSEHFDVRSRFMDGEELSAFDNALKPGLAGGFLFPDDFSLRPGQLTAQWTAALKTSGVTFMEGTHFEGVTRSGRNVAAIETSAGPVSADHFILATGAMSGRLARHFGAPLPVQPGKGYSITMDAPERMPKVAMLFLEHHVGITPFDNGFRIGSMMEFVGFDRTIPPARTAQLRDSASRYLAAPLPARNREEWYGWRPMTWDSLPIIGPMPGCDNVMLATGHNMLGMTLAPATGRLVAELVLGKTPHIDPAPYSAARFD